MVIQALLDVHSKRPCDVAIWGTDLSPDSVYCTPTAHVCSQNAERFLKSLDANFEEFIGVSRGCIYDILHRIKKDPNYYLGSLCTD